MQLNNKQFKITASPGQGNWAAVPWIGIFDIGITDTATEGYDVVYLFRADMSGVYQLMIWIDSLLVMTMLNVTPTQKK